MGNQIIDERKYLLIAVFGLTNEQGTIEGEHRFLQSLANC